MVKIALRATPIMKTNRKARCADVYRCVSKIDSRIKPRPPIAAPIQASVLKTLSLVRIWGISLEHKKVSQTFSAHKRCLVSRRIVVV
jgi:hypothetical protein